MKVRSARTPALNVPEIPEIPIAAANSTIKTTTISHRYPYVCLGRAVSVPWLPFASPPRHDRQQGHRIPRPPGPIPHRDLVLSARGRQVPTRPSSGPFRRPRSGRPCSHSRWATVSTKPPSTRSGAAPPLTRCCTWTRQPSAPSTAASSPFLPESRGSAPKTNYSTLRCVPAACGVTASAANESVRWNERPAASAASSWSTRPTTSSSCRAASPP